MSHAIHDKRSLLMHRLIARRLRRTPALRNVALENLRRWLSAPGVSASRRAAIIEWQPLLEGPLSALIAVLTDSGEAGTRLRQSSPFAGEAFIRQAERLRVLARKRP